MRLFLSSENVGNYPDELLKLVGDNKKVSYIGNAKDCLSSDERAAKVSEHRQQFIGLGFSDFSEIDLREYFDKKVPNNLLDDFGLIWCSGGNTFLLRSAMRLSGFDELLVKKIRANRLVYGGSSAGAVVVGPTLRGVEHGDDPSAVNDIYKTETIWNGLKLVDFVIVPHYDSDWFGKEAMAMQQSLEQAKVPHKTLVDGQVALFSNGQVEVLK